MSSHFDGPSSTLDLWSDENLADPFPAYARLRALGPAVRLERYDLIAFPRYAEVDAALVDWRIWSSASGVAVDEEANRAFPPGVLWSDPPEHAAFRRLLAQQLSGRRAGCAAAQIERTATGLADALVTGREIEAVGRLARPFGEAVIGDWLGLPEADREGLAERSALANEFFGPAGQRQRAGQAAAHDVIARAIDVGGRLAADSRGGELVAADQGINVASYTWPGTDNVARTVSAALHLFARHPGQWDLLRRDPALVPAATAEVLRMLSPLRHFTRLTTTTVRVGGSTVPAGSRILVMFASANRDERRFPDPDRFDVTRDDGPHLSYGRGAHRCVGANLANLAVHTLLHALLPRVARIEPCGDPEWTLNRTQLGLDGLPVRLVPA